MLIKPEHNFDVFEQSGGCFCVATSNHHDPHCVGRTVGWVHTTNAISQHHATHGPGIVALNPSILAVLSVVFPGAQHMSHCAHIALSSQMQAALYSVRQGQTVTEGAFPQHETVRAKEQPSSAIEQTR